MMLIKMKEADDRAIVSPGPMGSSCEVLSVIFFEKSKTWGTCGCTCTDAEFRVDSAFTPVFLP